MTSTCSSLHCTRLKLESAIDVGFLADIGNRSTMSWSSFRIFSESCDGLGCFSVIAFFRASHPHNHENISQQTDPVPAKFPVIFID